MVDKNATNLNGERWEKGSDGRAREEERTIFQKKSKRECVTEFNPVTCTEHAVSGWLLMTTGERD